MIFTGYGNLLEIKNCFDKLKMEKMKLAVFTLVLLGFSLSLAEAKCGFKTTEWEVKIGKNLHVAPIVENGELENVDDVRACMLHCMELDECVSFVHSASQRKCIFNDKKEQADEEVSDLKGVDYYELRSCSSDEDSGWKKLVNFIRDEPAYSAMAGMGILIILLTVFAVCAICIMGHDRRKSEEGF